jgi:hypothetical protein
MNLTPNIELSTYTSDPADKFNLLVTFNGNMNKIDTAIGAQNSQIDAIGDTAASASAAATSAVTAANQASTTAAEALEETDNITEITNFSILTSDWVNNTDVTTSTDYPFICTKSSDKFTNNSRPIYQFLGSGTIPTIDELTEASYISVVNFTDSGVTMYATEKPLNALNLVVKGV